VRVSIREDASGQRIRALAGYSYLNRQDAGSNIACNRATSCAPATGSRVTVVGRPQLEGSKVLTTLQYRVLRAIRTGDPAYLSGVAYAGKSKLEALLGDMLGDVRGKVVIDFGCGEGQEVIELAQRGAARVIGIDLNPSHLKRARAAAERAGVQDRTDFVQEATQPADLIVTLDSFEHFLEPAEILRIMYRLLCPGGAVMASFGPPWYHPLGGHLFSVFPWAHLIFSEAALIRWREDRRPDRPRTFREAGLNQITIRQFQRLVAATPFELERLEPVPIRRVRRLHNRITREFFTSIVRAKLRTPN
jgi:SAM-dependent methyltransferase